MAKNDQKWPKMIKNDQKMAKNGQKIKILKSHYGNLCP
jgi:hypothetical protein